MSDGLCLDGFKVYDFTVGNPKVSITNNGISFNVATVSLLGFPKYVQFMVNDEQWAIAVRACGKEDLHAVPFFRSENKNPKAVRWNSKRLINTITRMTAWDLNMDAYRVEGEEYGEGIIVFNLLKATLIK